MEQMATILINDYNIVFAYNLDGGGSTSTVLYNHKINFDVDSLVEDRISCTMLYWQLDETASDLKDNMFAQNKYGGQIEDFYHDVIMPMVVNKGNFEYYAHELSDCNEESLRNGIYVVRPSTSNSPGDEWYILIHLTWASGIQANLNIRQIALPLNENMPILWRLKYATGDYTSWRQYFGQTIPRGATADRPTDFLKDGSLYYDTTLHKLIIRDGSDWRDTMGNIV